MVTTEREKVDLKDFQFTTDLYRLETGIRRIGRPLFDGRDEGEVVAKLQYAFSIGGTPKEACGFGDISTDSFYRYCKNHPEFRNKIELLQTTLTLLARKNIFQALLDKDIKTSWWVLERKRPEEFSPSTSVEYKLKEKDQRIEYLENLLRAGGVSF